MVRAIRIALRTIHIMAAAMILGAVAFGGDPDPWPFLVVFTGVLIVITDIQKYGLPWFRYMQGAATVLKIVLVGIGMYWEPFLVPSLFAAIAIGAIISHSPGTVRHYPLWGRSGPCKEKHEPKPTTSLE